MAESKGKWTQEEQILYLYRGIEQLEAAGGKLSASHISMPGRTPKACIHFWDRIRKEMQAASNGANGTEQPPPATPTKRGSATPGSRKRAKKETTGEEGEAGDDEQLEVTTPVKRQRKTPVKKKAKAPVEADEDQNEMAQLEQAENIDGEV
ncbi:hypothetical protein F4861DRAFT_497490 [Xylaria intraflava]|nr:hypothetical protein F4861DRAFT_497490 [Xylaria intraflava]